MQIKCQVLAAGGGPSGLSAAAFLSTYRDPDKRMALFALPVPSANDPRTINIILPPNLAALVRLVQQVHPYQYNQKPWRLKLWKIKFLIQLIIHRASGRNVEMPGFMLSQRHRMSFVELERRLRLGNIAFYGLTSAVTVSIVWLFV